MRKKHQDDAVQKDRQEVKHWLEGIFHITFAENFAAVFNDETHHLRCGRLFFVTERRFKESSKRTSKAALFCANLPMC